MQETPRLGHRFVPVYLVVVLFPEAATKPFEVAIFNPGSVVVAFSNCVDVLFQLKPKLFLLIALIIFTDTHL